MRPAPAPGSTHAPHAAGDVTTTMLWIHGQISTAATMRDLVLPSALSVAVPVAAWALTAPEITSKVRSAGMGVVNTSPN